MIVALAIGVISIVLVPLGVVFAIDMIYGYRRWRRERREDREWEARRREANRTTLGDSWLKHQRSRFRLP